jgi:organic hydroperoxide reductase OsmC/OhrA
MSNYTAEVEWVRGDQEFLDLRYSRRHLLRFDGGLAIPGSSSPQVIPPPMSDEAALDPEEAFVSALSACHMLWFLSLAARRGFRIDRYRDAASGIMATDKRGRLSITTVTLRPEVSFSGIRLPNYADIDAIHHDAHHACFIANSVLTDVRCEPVYLAA